MLHLALLTLLALPGAPSAPPGQDLETLERELAASDAKVRQAAVGSLAALQAPAAWALVVGALDDPDARVADEAELLLAQIDEPTGLALLLGADGISSRNERVAARAAEAIGRVGFAVNQSKLTPFLSHDDERTRERILWSLERLALAGRLGGNLEGDPYSKVERVQRRDRSAQVRAQALQTMVAFAPQKAGSSVRDAAQDKEALVRASAVEAALTLPKPGPGMIYIELAEDPSYSVRRAVVLVLASLRDRVSVIGLIDRLEAEQEERLVWTIVAQLQRLSGLKYGRDPRPWREWAAGLSADWLSTTDGVDTQVGDASVAFAGMPVLSRRVAILIDMSGSMWEERDGKTRKQAVDAELRRLLESLPPETEFNVIPYTDAPKPWQKKLVSATRGNVKGALHDFERNRMSGKGAFWEAFLVALEDPRVDNVMVLTDGAPSGGEVWNVELMDLFIQQRDRFRGVVLDALLFDARGRLVKLWSEACAETGGRCRVIEL